MNRFEILDWFFFNDALPYFFSVSHFFYNIFNSLGIRLGFYDVWHQILVFKTYWRWFLNMNRFLNLTIQSNSALDKVVKIVGGPFCLREGVKNIRGGVYQFFGSRNIFNPKDFGPDLGPILLSKQQTPQHIRI